MGNFECKVKTTPTPTFTVTLPPNATISKVILFIATASIKTPTSSGDPILMAAGRTYWSYRS